MSITRVDNSNVVIAAVDSAEVILGENLKINLNLNKQENTENDITYLVRRFALLNRAFVQMLECSCCSQQPMQHM